MVITDVKINSMKPKDSGVCAECTITLDDEMQIHKLLVINGSKGYFVAFPNSGADSKDVKVRKYTDIVHPITAEFRQYITNTLVSYYKKALKDYKSE